MKKAVGLMIAVVFMFMQAGTLSAATRSFTVTASVPSATGVAISASSVLVSTNAFTPLASNVTSLSFDTMTFNTTYGFWAPDHVFAIDVGTVGGAGNVTTVVTYTEGTNQNSSVGGHGLGYKGLATFQKATVSGGVTTEATIAAHGKKKLIDLTGTTVTPAQVAGGWLRVYLGITTDPTAVGMPANAEIFSNADRSGIYDGTITFTATVA
ncbi:MAG: hypothetical protein HQL21_05425 [Candidatus Omnitrophica bacterium]|nr:hypothetical protein [Candidatus Omnitrophota bacterium]